MSHSKEPTGDIFALMDKAKMTAGNFLQGKVPMSQLVNEARLLLAAELKIYIQRRDQENFEKGFKEGKENQS